MDKICKRGFYIDTKRSENENLKAYAACLSRMATSLALMCWVSKPLLDDLEKALQKLDLETYEYLSNMRENDVPLVLNEPPIDVANSTISFRVPQEVKGVKTKRAKNVLEKVSRKKRNVLKEKVLIATCTYFSPYHVL
jgi:signal recognition particle subunit SEC65